MMKMKDDEKTLLSLSPFVDKRGILHSQSRLAKVDYLLYNTRFSIILSSETDFAKLLVQSAHREHKHGVGANAERGRSKNMC
jgi:hypothetical protein